MNIINFILLVATFNGLSFDKSVYTVTYKYTQQLEINDEIRRTYPPEIIDQILEANNQSHYFLMTTNEIESIIKLMPKISNSQLSIGVEVEPDLKWAYKKLDENYFVNLVEFGEKYFVKDSIHKLEWIDTNEEKKILGYQVRKYLNEERNLEIWCAKTIKIPNGPLNYAGYNYLVLEANILANKNSNHSFHFIATDISIDNKFNFKEEYPTKIISKNEFNKIFTQQREKEKKMSEKIDLD